MNIEKIKESQVRCKKRAQKAHIDRLKEKCYGLSSRLQYIRLSNRKLNCLRWHNNESREHIIKKLDICRCLKRRNHIFITEAIFLDGSRADIVDLTSSVIYEVLVSEKEESLEEKKKRYPKVFGIVKINHRKL